MYIGFHWEDSRITKLPPSSKDEKTFLDLQFSKVLWTPHIDVYNLREMISFNALKKDLAGDEVYLPYQYISIYRLLLKMDFEFGASYLVYYHFYCRLGDFQWIKSLL